MKLFVRTLQLISGLVALAVVWGLLEPRLVLDERAEVVSLPGLPVVWQQQEVALLADFQIGMWLSNEHMVQRAVNAVVTRRPAAVFIAGDFVYSPTDEERADYVEDLREGDIRHPVQEKIRRVLALLQPLLRSGIPTYAVLGNHDYGMHWDSSTKLAWVAARLRKALEEAGVTVLVNQAVAMAEPARAPGMRVEHPRSDAHPPLYLGGVGSLYADEADIEATLAAIPRGAPRLILMHNPQAFAAFPAGTAPLALAAHTHGGQIRIPGLPTWSWLNLAKERDVRTDGWIRQAQGAAGNRLYVNRGIGFSTAPLRINCPPEVTYLRLVAR